MSSEPLPHTFWTRVRTVLNWLNLSTPLGLLIARIGGATITRRGRGTYLATGYRYGFSMGFSYTFGTIFNNIVNTRF